MNRVEFLGVEDVMCFVEWLRNVSSGIIPFEHDYQMARGQAYHFNSIFEAYELYSWPFQYTDHFAQPSEDRNGVTWESNAEALNYIAQRLTENIENLDLQSRNLHRRNACKMALDWGGILGPNLNKLNVINGFEYDYLSAVTALFDDDGITLRTQYSVNINGNDVPVIMNSGFTKIYSLICSDFIIYDGRVGAALGLLVRIFCQQTGRNNVPGILKFHYGPARNRNVNRNPSVGNFHFPMLSSGSVHIRDNLKANWIISAVLADNNNQFFNLPSPRRSFEAALFMIGYRMP